MNRKQFIRNSAACCGGFAVTSFRDFPECLFFKSYKTGYIPDATGLSADLVIAGGGLGGCAAAMAALHDGLKVIMTEETGWIGGQLTSQGVPPDEHQWIESHGATKLYRDFRNQVRQYYRKNYPLSDVAKNTRYLNPGDGSVSRLCCEPRVSLAVLQQMLAPWINSKKLILMTDHKITGADAEVTKIRSLRAENLINGNSIILSAPYFIDATELGDLLPLTGTAYVTGTESQADTGELHAPEKSDPVNNQAFTICFAIDYLPGESHLIEKPLNYEFWSNFIPRLDPPWPGKLLNMYYSNPSTLKARELGFNPEASDTSPLLNLWTYRRIINRNNFTNGTFKSDISLVNWPQNDYMNGNLIGTTASEFSEHIRNAKQLSLSLLYWLQTEAPRSRSGYGWPGLRIRNDIMGSDDGLAKYPYIRESRRIKPLFRILEEHVGKENREIVTGNKESTSSAFFYDSIGTGYYHIDLHPTCSGNNYIDFDSLPFQIPMGALIPEQTENLLAANKNIGTTHITNGCYRLHPVEWNIGESAGHLVAFALKKKVPPAGIRQKKELLEEFQNQIRAHGIETEWPKF